jgi:hypothetical protein
MEYKEAIRYILALWRVAGLAQESRNIQISSSAVP